MPSTANSPLSATCVASTGDAFNAPAADSEDGRRTQSTSHGHRQYGQTNYFREAQFTGDGTSIITHNADQRLRTFVLPSELLDESQQPHDLNPHASFKAPSNIQSYAVYPGFDLRDPSTTLILSALADQPLTLRNALDYTAVHASYSYISPTTEEYIPAPSLAFTRDGTQFVAGSDGQTSVFDCSQYLSPPIKIHRTQSRKARKLYGTQGMTAKGLVTALSISGDGVLASGTTQREIALYSSEGRGECLTAFSIAPRPGEEDPVKGQGIMHLRWSPDGKYLLVAERQSDGIQVYDVRSMLRRVSWLSGRKAATTQRLGIEVVPTKEGYEVWGGGTDGCVRMWRNAGAGEGEQKPDAEMRLHDDAVSSAVWHPGGAVMATCSGQRHYATSNAWSPTTVESDRFDSKLAIWTVK